MTDWITSIVERFSYGGVVFLMFLENVFPPIPSELIMPLAGFVSAEGRLSFWGVIIAGTAGSVLGALPLYGLGHSAGEKRLRSWLERRGHWVGVSSDDLTKAIDWFDRRGGLTVLFCRLIPGVRSLISIPAGLAHMNFVVFLAYT
ncbi:MAG TPA: DedA family protein, partial [Candidatus Synoicihabitans sp.]|nr:DedA family protein [Candidatus Synoicihabitans sp.]